MDGALSSSPLPSARPTVAERRNGDRDPGSGRFVRGNRAASGRKKSHDPDVQVPPAPQSLVMAELDGLWPGLFRKAAGGSTSHIELVLRLRKADPFDLIGEEELEALTREID